MASDAQQPLTILLSFDIDGTLECGDPPGRVTLAMVRRAQEMGYIIGSASDKPVPVQKSLWEKHGIDMQFTIHKHRLDQIRAQFQADVYQHIGDTDTDEHYALLHGFEFLDVFTCEEPWMIVDDVAAPPPGRPPIGRYVLGPDATTRQLPSPPDIR